MFFSIFGFFENISKTWVKNWVATKGKEWSHSLGDLPRGKEGRVRLVLGKKKITLQGRGRLCFGRLREKKKEIQKVRGWLGSAAAGGKKCFRFRVFCGFSPFTKLSPPPKKISVAWYL